MGRTCVGRQIGMLGAPIGAIGGVIPWWDPNEEGLCVWSAYQPVGAASFAASLVDLSGNGNDAIDPGGAATPGWNAINGWIFDGIDDYLRLVGFITQNDQSQSAIVQFTNVTNINSQLFGVWNNGDRFQVRPTDAGLNVLYNNGGQQVVVGTLLAGNLAVAGNQGYRNGAADGGLIAAWGAASTNRPVAIGAAHRGAPFNFCAADVQAFALYDCVLTAPQVLAVATAMAAL